MDKKLKVLIADDEAKVGQLVKRLIMWDELGLTCLGIETDGQSAYDRIVQDSPDIVITDIRMPVLTGLEMIEKANAQGIHCHFIVVSGYKYFDYAQKALKYGVEDYLLKPIDEDELNRQLRRIVESESARRVQTQYVDTMEKRLNDSKYFRHKEFLKQITMQSDTDIEQVNTEFGLKLMDTLFRAVCFKVDRDLAFPENDQQMGLVLKHLVHIVENRFTDLTVDLIVAAQKNNSVQVVLNYMQIHSKEIDRNITDTLEEMKDYIANFIHYSVTAGVSEEVEEFHNIHVAIEMSRESVDERLFKGAGRRIDYHHANRNFVMSDIDFEKNLTELKKVVETVQYDAVKYQIHRCFHRASEQDLFASEFYAIGKMILQEVSSLLIFEDGETIDWEAGKTALENCTSVSQLRDYLTEYVVNALRQYQEARVNQERRPVLEAIAYMKEHYADRITLEDVAQISGFNTNYFSELFKKETGENFSNYLLGIRMEEAKRLLRDTNEAVYSIGEQVGYKDAKYFSQQFIKVVGIKPAEYRKLYY